MQRECDSTYHTTTTECSPNGAQSSKYATKRPGTTTNCNQNGREKWQIELNSKASETNERI